MMKLPLTDPAFRWTAEAWGDALRCDPLSAIAQHAFTTRQLPLRLQGDGSRDAYTRAWSQAAASVGGDVRRVRRVKQVHGAGVRLIENDAFEGADAGGRPEADALASNVAGLVLCVQVADCVPILLADCVSGAAAAVHAGWRGTCARVVVATVNAMARRFGARPVDLVAALGPSIGPCCYGVGETVREAFRAEGSSHSEIARWFAQDDGGVLRLDLWRANREQLQQAGLSADRIHVSGLCTQTHVEIFESYRVHGERAGRMAALICVP